MSFLEKYGSWKDFEILASLKPELRLNFEDKFYPQGEDAGHGGWRHMIASLKTWFFFFFVPVPLICSLLVRSLLILFRSTIANFSSVLSTARGYHEKRNWQGVLCVSEKCVGMCECTRSHVSAFQNSFQDSLCLKHFLSTLL